MHQPSELRGSNQGGHLQDGVILLLRPEHFVKFGNPSKV